MTWKLGKGPTANGEKIVRRQLADGSVKEYRYRPMVRKPRIDREKGAIRQLAELYVKSPEFKRLSVKWQSAKKYYLGLLEDEFAWVSIADLNNRNCRTSFYRVRDELCDTPNKADKLIDTLKGLLAWAYERNKIDVNHALAIPHLADSGKVRNDIIWIEDHEAIVYASFPNSLVEAFRFALFSAMRQSDMCALKWENYKDGWITYTPNKTAGTTGVKVHLPVYALPPFQELVDGLSRCSEYMLTTETGHPMEAENLRVRWRDALYRSDLKGEDLHWHDLRGTATTRLLEAGCTDAEVAAITGHSIGSGTKLGDYAARSRQLALNAFQKWALWMHSRPQVIPFGKRDGKRGK